MFSRFFIDRPIFAAVLAIFIVIAGLSATRSLPISNVTWICTTPLLVDVEPM